MLKSQRELDHSNLTVGELLKKKAEDGVRVLLMIWGETTSIMGTHDTETENFFKGKSGIYPKIWSHKDLATKVVQCQKKTILLQIELSKVWTLVVVNWFERRFCNLKVPSSNLGLF